jgi:hypothetical protein
MATHPYDPSGTARHQQNAELERLALRIAFSEGRGEVTHLDRVRAARELRLPDNEIPFSYRR